MNTEDVLTGAVDRPYGQLQYAVSGRNHGQAVLLLHPLGSDLAFWQPQLETLGLRFRVIRFEARGHGDEVEDGGGARIVSPDGQKVLRGDAGRLAKGPLESGERGR